MPEVTIVGYGWPEVTFCNSEGDVVDISDLFGADYSHGFDLAATEDYCLHEGMSRVVKTGLFIKEVTVIDTGKRLLVPDMQIRPRSGTSLKTPLVISNAPGTIDSTYGQEIGVIVRLHTDEHAALDEDGGFLIERGDRIAQMVIGVATIPYPKGGKVRVGGFGSTGGN